MSDNFDDNRSSLAASGSNSSRFAKRSSVVSRLLNFHLFRHGTSETSASPPPSAAASPRLRPSVSRVTEEQSPLNSSRRSTVSGYFPAKKQSITGSIFSVIGRRLHPREHTWAGPGELDTNAAERLREFYLRNSEACNRDAEELERRASLWKAMQHVSQDQAGSIDCEKEEKWEHISDTAGLVSGSSASTTPQGQNVVTFIDLEGLIKECNSPRGSDEPSRSSDTASPRHRRLLFRKSSSIKPAEESVAAVAALQGFSRSTGSGRDSAEDLIQPYDVFSPDMRSTRWNEFCKVLQHDRADFNQYLKNVRAVRGSNKAVTLAGIRRAGITSPY